MQFFRFFLYFIILLVALFTGLVFYVDSQLANKDFSDSYNSCHKVWSARGLYDKYRNQNSIKSVTSAFNQGAMGVEVDVYYDLKLNNFIVSHDYPYNKKDGEILKLSTLLKQVGDGHYFWLDFKRLRHLDEKQTQLAIQRLFDISTKNNLSQRLYIEGADPLNIFQYQKAGLHTIFDTHPLPESAPFISALVINIYKIFFHFGDHNVMAMKYGKLADPIYGPQTRERLKNVPVFLYHTPIDKALIKELITLKNVRVILAGENRSVNYFDITSCRKTQ